MAQLGTKRFADARDGEGNNILRKPSVPADSKTAASGERALITVGQGFPEFPAKLHIALLDGDKSTHELLRQMIKRHAPGWTLQIYSDANPLPIAAWAKARARHDGAARNGASVEDAPPDVLLLEIGSRRKYRAEHIRKLKSIFPALAVLLLTNPVEPYVLLPLLMSGASGCVDKGLALPTFTRAIRDVAKGQAALCPDAQNAILAFLQSARTSPPAGHLSGRELQVLAWTAQGLYDKEIAKQMGIAANTVHVHQVNIFRKLGAHHRSEALQKHFGLSSNLTGK